MFCTLRLSPLRDFVQYEPSFLIYSTFKMTNKVFEYQDLNEEENKLFEETYGYESDIVRVKPKGFIVTKKYKNVMAEEIYNMPLRSSDVFVASYQRSGTTWTQELVWLLANDLDYKQAAEVPLTLRYPFLEIAMFFDEEHMGRKLNLEKEGVHAALKALETPATKTLAEMTSPRFVKTHLPMSLLPPKLLDTAKVVYVARDPRDVIVSCYHHAKLFKPIEFNADFKHMWKFFQNDLYTCNPYFEHVKEAWAQRDHPNMLFLFYEDLSKDLPESINRVAKFFGKELNEEQMERLCDHLHIKNFRNNPSVNFEDMRVLGFMNEKETFIRKGKAGGWREYFDEELTREADEWIEENLRDSDLRFPSMEKK